MPPSLNWLEYLIFYKYSFFLMASNEFRGLNFTLAPIPTTTTTTTAAGPSNPADPATAFQQQQAQMPPVVDGGVFIELIGIDDVSEPVAWAILIAITLGFRTIAFLALSLRLRRKVA